MSTSNKTEKFVDVTISFEDQHKILNHLKFVKSILAKDEDVKEMQNLMERFVCGTKPYQKPKGWMKRWKKN